MSEKIKQEEGIKMTWLRGLYMFLFAFLFGVAKVVTITVVVFQLFNTVITGNRNENLLKFGSNLAQYMYDILLFQTFNSEQHPFPFSPWPQ